MAQNNSPGTYGEFWRRYLHAHRRPGTRLLHYGGTALGSGFFLTGLLLLDPRLMVGGVVLGYGLAWAGHFLIEGNRPATFGHPFWSLFSDYRMLGLWLSGRLGRELAAAEKNSHP